MSAAVADKKQTTQSPNAIEERSVTYVPIGEKDELVLSVGQVEKFLCVKTRSGKIACREDIMKFMMLCKAQGLNPWVNDAYLVGYDTNDGPKFQLISAHQALLKRAELSDNYDGMASGVCVLSPDGSVIERQGDLVIKGETLVGGWARVHRRDRSVPSYDALKLETFTTGKSRWSADPAGMIVKCAEASALRKAFPSTMAQMYCREEMERQIETGDRDRHAAIESTTQVIQSSKSEALATVLKARTQQAKTDQGRENTIETTATQSGESHSEPTHTLTTLRQSVDEAGYETGMADEDGKSFKATLDDGSTLLVSEVSIPVSENTHLVVVSDNDAPGIIDNIINHAKKKR